jgi:hypothetical protein
VLNYCTLCSNVIFILQILQSIRCSIYIRFVLKCNRELSFDLLIKYLRNDLNYNFTCYVATFLCSIIFTVLDHEYYRFVISSFMYRNSDLREVR